MKASQEARDRARAWALANPERAKANKRKSYLANRERNLERAREWQKANPEKVREAKRKWREANRDKTREINRLYYLNNTERVRANAEAWRLANAERWSEILRVNNMRRLARKRNAPTYLVTPKDIARILARPCAVTGCDATNIQLDHVIPLARGGSHGIGNLQALCGHHNASKNDRTWMEFRRFLTLRESVAA